MPDETGKITTSEPQKNVREEIEEQDKACED